MYPLPLARASLSLSLSSPCDQTEVDEEEDLGLELSDLDVKDSLVSWTYSQYIEALDKEEALNKPPEEVVEEEVPEKPPVPVKKSGCNVSPANDMVA